MRPQIANRMTALGSVARRNFSKSAVRMDSPYHYPTGPRSNIPFNPLTRFFYVRYIAFCAVGFSLPFGIAVWQTKKKSFL
ncbi:hypothetical protein TWF696_009871 [Orbilia brochopaga]|uniref:Cytochrome c oxidase subunit 8, mitochondrial n=1 Tax=Orbilia brochopaga TaxID=3140254 RepID=A0AAV9UC94_9PEZI